VVLAHIDSLLGISIRKIQSENSSDRSALISAIGGGRSDRFLVSNDKCGSPEVRLHDESSFWACYEQEREGVHEFYPPPRLRGKTRLRVVRFKTRLVILV
jgi:hypothetical protein